MQGATADLGGRFHSAAEDLAIAGDAFEPTPTQSPLRVRGSDEEEWTPLLAATDR